MSGRRMLTDPLRKQDIACRSAIAQAFGPSLKKNGRSERIEPPTPSLPDRSGRRLARGEGRHPITVPTLFLFAICSYFRSGTVRVYP